MLLCILIHVSIFVGLGLSQQREASNDFEGGIGPITPLAPRQNNFTWTNTSSIPPEATVEIQFDGLAGSGVINLTSHAGFTVINLTSTGMPCGSLSPLTANMTSAGIQTTNDYFPTATLPANTTTLASSSSTIPPTMANSSMASSSSTMPPTMANSSMASNASMSPLLLPTSANISVFTGAGVLSKIPLPNLLTWLLLGSLPTAILLGG